MKTAILALSAMILVGCGASPTEPNAIAETKVRAVAPAPPSTPSGTSLSGSVGASRATVSLSLMGTSYRTTADTTGRYFLGNLRPGSGELTVLSSTCFNASVPVTLRPGANVLNMEVCP
jgi:hypothetical protein